MVARCDLVLGYYSLSTETGLDVMVSDHLF